DQVVARLDQEAVRDEPGLLEHAAVAGEELCAARAHGAAVQVMDLHRRNPICPKVCPVGRRRWHTFGIWRRTSWSSSVTSTSATALRRAGTRRRCMSRI